jgi:hypothetical protein
MSATIDPAYARGHAQLEELVDEGVARSRLSRSRFLGWLGAGMFGAVMSAVLPATKAEASTCVTYKAPCYGYPICSYACTGCCRSDTTYCDPHCYPYAYGGCPSGSTCWYECYGGKRHRCCDCKSSGNWCICNFITGTC